MKLSSDLSSPSSSSSSSSSSTSTQQEQDSPSFRLNLPPPCRGFNLLDSTLLANAGPTPFPLAPSTVEDSSRRTTEERRQHLIQVLQSAITILDEEDDIGAVFGEEDDSILPNRRIPPRRN